MKMLLLSYYLKIAMKKESYKNLKTNVEEAILLIILHYIYYNKFL
jgi:hypothetical protein